MIELQSIFPPALQSKLRALVTTVAPDGNLAAHVQDDPARVILNRRLLLRQGQLPRAPEWLRQVHGTHVAHLQGPQLTMEQRIADACVTAAVQRPCAILTADCLPVLFYHQNGDYVAAAHAGWRGLAQGVLQQTLAQIPTLNNEIHAWIGPAISQPHFQVGDDVRDAFVRVAPEWAIYFLADGSRWRCDLSGLAAALLKRAGVASVQQSGWCSYAEAARWFSYRRDPHCGRMATLIWKVS